MKTLAIGIDIGGTRTKIGLVDLDAGRVERLLVTPTETQDSELFLHGLGTAIDQLRADATASGTVLTGIGIGVPSFVFTDGTVDSTYGFLRFMEDYPLADLMQQRHALPCRVDNDVRVVALGEALYGEGRGHYRVLVLTLGTGLGLGFTIDGRLDGPLPLAHMGGHLTITTSEVVCYCGKTGCLESLVSSAGVLRIAERYHWAQQHPNLPLTAESIFGQREAGSSEADAVISLYIDYLRTGIDNYVNLYAPDRIVLGGGIAKGLRNDLDRLHTPSLLNPYKSYRTSLAVSALEEQAGILGSAALFNKRMSE